MKKLLAFIVSLTLVSANMEVYFSPVLAADTTTTSYEPQKTTQFR